MGEMKEDAVIRKATVADAAETARYMRELRAEAKDGDLDTIPWRPPLSDAQQAEFLTTFLAGEHNCMFLALTGDEVVGMVDIHGGQFPHDRHAGWLGISLAPGWRGKGIGRRLMKAAIAEAQSWPEFCRIELQCVVWNAAGIHLYHSLGFVTEARKIKSVNRRGKPEDEYLMALVW